MNSFLQTFIFLVCIATHHAVAMTDKQETTRVTLWTIDTAKIDTTILLDATKLMNDRYPDGVNRFETTFYSKLNSYIVNTILFDYFKINLVDISLDDPNFQIRKIEKALGNCYTKLPVDTGYICSRSHINIKKVNDYKYEVESYRKHYGAYKLSYEKKSSFYGDVWLPSELLEGRIF